MLTLGASVTTSIAWQGSFLLKISFVLSYEKVFAPLSLDRFSVMLVSFLSPFAVHP